MILKAFIYSTYASDLQTISICIPISIITATMVASQVKKMITIFLINIHYVYSGF